MYRSECEQKIVGIAAEPRVCAWLVHLARFVALDCVGSVDCNILLQRSSCYSIDNALVCISAPISELVKIVQIYIGQKMRYLADKCTRVARTSRCIR